MAKFERQMSARAAELLRYLDEQILLAGAELVDSSVQKLAGSGVYLCLYRLDSVPFALQIVGADVHTAIVTDICTQAALPVDIENLLDLFAPIAPKYRS